MCLHGALCCILFYLIGNMTTFIKKCFELLTPPQGSRVCVRTEYVHALALCSISVNLICSMTSFRKRMLCTVLCLTPGAEGVCKDREWAWMLSDIIALEKCEVY